MSDEKKNSMGFPPEGKEQWKWGSLAFVFPALPVLWTFVASLGSTTKGWRITRGILSVFLTVAFVVVWYGILRQTLQKKNWNVWTICTILSVLCFSGALGCLTYLLFTNEIHSDPPNAAWEALVWSITVPFVVTYFLGIFRLCILLRHAYRRRKHEKIGDEVEIGLWEILMGVTACGFSLTATIFVWIHRDTYTGSSLVDIAVAAPVWLSWFAPLTWMVSECLFAAALYQSDTEKNYDGGALLFLSQLALLISGGLWCSAVSNPFSPWLIPARVDSVGVTSILWSLALFFFALAYPIVRLSDPELDSGGEKYDNYTWDVTETELPVWTS